ARTARGPFSIRTLPSAYTFVNVGYVRERRDDYRNGAGRREEGRGGGYGLWEIRQPGIQVCRACELRGDERFHRIHRRPGRSKGGAAKQAGTGGDAKGIAERGDVQSARVAGGGGHDGGMAKLRRYFTQRLFVFRGQAVRPRAVQKPGS